MLHLLDFAREMTPLAVTLRMLSAVICGGLVGIEREFKRRPAGFRTHILICLGASVTILTNLYLYQVMHLYTDISRMGAQAIAGIGFIGAGTIIVTKRKRVKGLTTAAGLWTIAIVGLVCGAGCRACACAGGKTDFLGVDEETCDFFLHGWYEKAAELRENFGRMMEAEEKDASMNQIDIIETLC